VTSQNHARASDVTVIRIYTPKSNVLLAAGDKFEVVDWRKLDVLNVELRGLAGKDRCLLVLKNL
jgi:hypothetical protein